MAVIYRYTMTQFNELYPEFANKVAPGKIPRAIRYLKQLEKTWLQTTYQGQDTIEVCHYTSIAKKQVVFAGAACSILEKFEGKEFPYMMDNEAYLPLLWMRFFPSSEGLYDYGVGQMLYDLIILCARMNNMAYNHAGDNIYPITFVNSPNKGASKLFGEILKAHEMRANGGKGYVVSENQQGAGSGVTLEQFQTPPITAEWERITNDLYREIERLGFKLDMPDLGSSPNEMSILSLQESTDAPIKQITEFNGPEYEMAIKMAMEALRQFVDVDDQTPINSMTDIETADAKFPMRGIPLGWVAEELRQNKYFVVVNTKSGVVQSNVMEQTQLDRAMRTVTPGSPAWNKLSIKMAAMNGQNIKEEDLAMPQAPQVAPQGGESSMPSTETSPVSAYDLKHPQK
jgi:hypothetical protein